MTNNEDAIKKKILKYDGSVFFEDASDIYLNKSSIECAVDFCFSKKVALFSTNEKYQLLDSRGKIIKEYEKIANVNKPKIQAQKNDEEMDRYITSYYNGKTDVIDTNSNEIIGLLNGDYYVIDVNTNNENQFILYKNDDVNKHTIVFNNGKKTFDTTSCYNVFFQDDEVNCLVGNSIFDYYDINGNKINK